MKKIALYAFVLLATAFTACTEDFADWAEPQGFEQEEAVGVSFSATAGASIDFATYEGETVTVFNPSVTMPEGATVSGYKLTVNGNDLPVDLNGQANTEEYESLVIALNGRRPTERTMTATVDAFIAIGNETLKASATIELKATPEAPVISANHYIIGAPSEWNPGCTTLKFNHSGKDVYDDPIFTITFPVTEGENWFAVTDDVSVEHANDWSYVFGCVEGNGNNGTEGQLARRSELSDDGSFNVVVNGDAKFIKMTINMLEYTYKIEKLNFGEYIYIPGDHVTDWNPALAPALASPAFDGVYTGFAYLNTQFKFTHARNWDNEYNYSSFSTYSDIFSGEGAGNINVSTPGFYYLEANVPAGSLTATPTAWSIIGAATGDTSWGTDFEMTYDNETGAWIYTGELVAGEFKFRANKAWDIDFGGTFEELVRGGGNLSIAEAGTYEVKLYLTRSTSDKLYCTVTKK